MDSVFYAMFDGNYKISQTVGMLRLGCYLISSLHFLLALALCLCNF